MTHDHCDISVIITAHREGMLAGITAQSADAAIAHAASCNLACEVIVVLDRSNDLTRQTLCTHFDDRATYLETDFGDPGLARNTGVDHATGTCACFLDADDLWSENWLSVGYAFIQKRPDAIAHSACNITFGDDQRIWWHTDSESDLCDPDYLEWMNYWDALVFARTDMLQRFPYRANDLVAGYAHEDWHWNKVTLYAGVPHKPVPGTIHFKRRRPGSQSERVDQKGGLPWPVRRPDAVGSHLQT